MTEKTKIGFLFVAMTVFIVAIPGRLIAVGIGNSDDVHKVDNQRVSITCHESSKYLVVAKETKNELGTDFLIKRKSEPDEKLSCDYSLGNGDFEIKNEWAEYFAALKGDLLILDSTTGPGPSGLIIWNLEKRKKVFEGTWSNPEKIRDNSLVYWLETGKATEDNCPGLKEWRQHGLGGAIETRVILNLSDFTISRAEETRCSPRQ
jgi:hypothetical protein